MTATNDPTDITDVVDVEATHVDVSPVAKQTTSLATWSPKMVVPIDEAVAAIDQRREFMGKVLERIDGALVQIPGVSKKILGKPGAEALLNAFGLRAELEDEEPPVLDFTGEQHGGEPFFRHRQRCRIFWYLDADTRICVAQASGSCNSWESKYRYRNAERVCPKCNAAAIKKSKYPPRNAPRGTEPGWYCYAKVGGCSAEFAAKDPAIVEQQLGKVANPDLADIENTVLKMAEKRALVAATIIATSYSDLVTQDVDDNAPPTAQPASVAATATGSGGTPPQPSGALKLGDLCPLCKAEGNEIRLGGTRDRLKCANNHEFAATEAVGDVDPSDIPF
jgi:hypothetical protein